MLLREDPASADIHIHTHWINLLSFFGEGAPFTQPHLIEVVREIRGAIRAAKVHQQENNHTGAAGAEQVKDLEEKKANNCLSIVTYQNNFTKASHSQVFHL